MEYCLRRAVAADFYAINRLFVEMLKSIYEKDDVQGYADGDLDYYFSGGEDWICVAESDGGVIGFLAIEVHREQQDYIYYDDFCVTESQRGNGVGAALMHEAERYCKSLGFDTVALHVEKHNALARRFYGNRGFTTIRDDGARLCLVKHI